MLAPHNDINRGKSKAKTMGSVPFRFGLWFSLALALLVAVIAAVVALFRNHSVNEVAPDKPTPKRIVEVAPSQPSAVNDDTPAQSPEPEGRRTPKGTLIPDNVQPDQRGVLRYPNGQRWVDPNDLHVVQHPQKRKLFNRTCDNQLAIILTLDPSRMAPHLIGRRHPYGDEFVRDFVDSLSDKYAPDPDDTDEESAVRQMVIETRKELKAALDRGEDIAELMNATQDELDRLCQYQDMLKKELREIEYDETVSDEDFEDYVKAANIMLEKQGLNGLTMPNVVTRQAKIQKMKEFWERKAKENNQ